MINESRPTLEDRFPMLSLVVTDLCNQRCSYCPPMGEGHACSAGDLTTSQVDRIVDAAFDLGFRSFRVSGGEPTVHRAFPAFIETLRRLRSKGCYTTLNTNAQRLERFADSLRGAPLDLLRVSLDSLDAERYEKITGSRVLNKVLAAIEMAKQLGLRIRINMLVLQSNVDEVPRMIEWCIASGFELKLLDVEQHAFDARSVWEREFVYLAPLRDDLRRTADKSKWTESWGGFGMTTEDFFFGDTLVRVKDSTVQSTYHPACAACPFFPCAEGAYALVVTPDHRVTWCRRRPDLSRDLGATTETVASALKAALDDIRRASVQRHGDMRVRLGQQALLRFTDIQRGVVGAVRQAPCVTTVGNVRWTQGGARFVDDDLA